MWTDELRREYPELADWDLTEVDIVDDGEKLATIADESQDFIVANHMLEHTEDPVGTILNHLSKLRPGGVLFYAVPDKRYTFDFRRPLTPIEHMFDDHDEGPERSRAEHFREWCRLVIDEESPSVGTAEQAASPEWVEERAQQLEAQGYSIHMHVWTQAEFLELLLALREREEEAFDIEIAARTGIEFVVVLRKRGPLPAPTAATAPLTEPPPAGRAPAPQRQPALARLRQAGAGTGAGGDRETKGEAIADRAPGTAAPLAIEARDLEKSFAIPTHRVDSLKERMVRPFAAKDVRILHALDGVSFDIHQGEFFGIVGRNGSGKSTLLKLLASIYRADAGTIRMAGRLAPFIELGVGFNPELTARENVVLNGVMMGLTPKETRQKLDSVIEFAELEEFVDLKLKNYSSGMQVRLAFSVMLEADADVLLIDEVLAVGDAAFQQKCADVFHAMKAAGKTIILVTHEMTSVQEYCHRAMLIDDGKVLRIGDPGEVGRHYLQLNFERGSPEDHATVAAQPGDEIELLDIWLEDESGARVNNIEHGVKFNLCTTLKALQPMTGIGVGFTIANADGMTISDIGVAPDDDEGELLPIAAGERITVRAEIENLLAAGRYFIHLGVNRANAAGVALYVNSAVDFAVFGGGAGAGFVSLPHEIEADIGSGEREESRR